MNNTVGKKTKDKLKKLGAFLEEKHGISLYRAISVSESKINDILS